MIEISEKALSAFKNEIADLKFRLKLKQFEIERLNRILLTMEEFSNDKEK